MVFLSFSMSFPAGFDEFDLDNDIMLEETASDQDMSMYDMDNVEEDKSKYLEALYALYDNGKEVKTDDLSRDLELLQQNIILLRVQEASLKGIFAQGPKPLLYAFSRWISLGTACGLTAIFFALAYKCKDLNKNDFKNKKVIGMAGIAGVLFFGVVGVSLKIYSKFIDKTDAHYEILDEKLAVIRAKIARDGAIIDALIANVNDGF